MKTQTHEKRNNIGIVDDKYNFNDICNDLDKKHESYLSGNMKTYSLDKIWNNFLNRNNTFLTRK